MRYLQKILAEHVLPAAEKLYGGNCELVHDNAPAHTARYTKAALENMKLKVGHFVRKKDFTKID